MRNLSVTMIFLLGAGAVLANDDAEEQARETITKAIKATGLEGRPIPKAFRIKSKYTLDVLDEKLEFVEAKINKSLTVQFPFQFKEVNEITLFGKTSLDTVIYDGKNGWLKFEDKIQDPDERGLNYLRELANVTEATHFLTPLLDKQKYKLKATKMALVDGRRTSEIRVSREGFEDMKLYFDYKTNLLIKSQRKTLDPRFGLDCKEARYFRSYQKMNGRLVPGTVVIHRNGELAYELQTLEYTELENVDAKEFAAPK